MSPRERTRVHTTPLEDQLLTVNRLLQHIEQQVATMRHVVEAASRLAKTVASSALPSPTQPEGEPRIAIALSPRRILRGSEVVAMCGLSRSTIWRLQRAGQFPQRCRIAPGAVGWLHDDIESWVQRVASQRDRPR